MSVSYKSLWKLLIDRDMTKGKLSAEAGIATSTISRMSRNEYVSLEVLEKICIALDCDLPDIIEFSKDKTASATKDAYGGRQRPLMRS